MAIYLDKTPVDGWAALLAAMPDKEFRNLTRSTVPHLAYCMLQGLERNLDYHFEYTVPSVPRAKASHTDLMVIGDESVLGVEAKSAEPRYKTVSEWLSRGGGLQASALQRWVALVEAATGQQASITSLEECVYQSVHRLASVCSIDRSQRSLIYQVFDFGGIHHFYVEDLARLVETFALDTTVEVRYQRIDTTLTAEGNRLISQLEPIPVEQRPALIRRGVLSGELFKFRDETSEVISHDSASRG